MTYRLVALGDSTVEGLMDPGPDGAYVGWADRFAALMAARHPDLLYANLGVRGQTAAEVRRTQLSRALSMAPDVALLVAGVNDVLRPRLDRPGVRESLLTMFATLRDAGAQVLTFTMPDMRRVAPLTYTLRHRIEYLNEVLREAGTSYGALVVDFAAEPLAGHRRSGTTTGCTPTPRGTGGSRRRWPRSTAWTRRTGGPSFQRPPRPAWRGSSAARCSGSAATSPRGSGGGCAATSSRPAAGASAPTCCRSPTTGAGPPGSPHGSRSTCDRPRTRCRRLVTCPTGAWCAASTS